MPMLRRVHPPSTSAARPRMPFGDIVVGLLLAVLITTVVVSAQSQPSPHTETVRPAGTTLDAEALTDRYCLRCHDDTEKSGGFSLEHFDLAHPGTDAAQAEKIILKLQTGL